jgi:NAD(P)-dependent dehydrogenase (short-subunit alcohol dehydrogenase family)
MDLAGKVALITGAGGGIGGGLAEACAEAGMLVWLADIALELAEAKAREIGGGARAIALDVTSLDSWAAVRDATGAVDLLCNNAGIATQFELLEAMDPALFQRVMAINVGGVYHGIHTFLPAMKTRGAGHIVNTSSTNGLLPHGTFAAYCASKFAVLGMSDSLRQEVEPFGVGVSVLFPGLTRSRMSEAMQGQLGMDDASWAEFSANMMEPVWLGRAVVRAVQGNLPYVITHPDHGPMVERRHQAIMAAHGEPAQPGYAPNNEALGFRD